MRKAWVAAGIAAALAVGGGAVVLSQAPRQEVTAAPTPSPSLSLREAYCEALREVATIASRLARGQDTVDDVMSALRVLQLEMEAAEPSLGIELRPGNAIPGSERVAMARQFFDDGSDHAAMARRITGDSGTGAGISELSRAGELREQLSWCP